MVGDDDIDEAAMSGIPALQLDSSADEEQPCQLYALIAHSVATETVDAAVQEAMQDVSLAVARATEWLAEAVGGELISEAVIAVSPRTSPSNALATEDPLFEDAHRPQEKAVPHLCFQVLTEIAHELATATVEHVTGEALNAVVRAVENATEWMTQAVLNEVVSEAVAPDEVVSATLSPSEEFAVQDATARLTEALRCEIVARAVVTSTPPSNNPFDLEKQGEENPPAETKAIQVVPQSSLQGHHPSVAEISALAKATVDAALSCAIQNLSQAIDDASRSRWLTRAVPEEELAQAVTNSSLGDDLQIDDTEKFDNDVNDFDKLPEQAPPSPEPVHISMLKLPQPISGTEAVAKCHEIAEPFVDEFVLSAIQKALTPHLPEPQDEGDEEYEDDYTPITTPTAEEKPQQMPVLPVSTPKAASAPASEESPTLPVATPEGESELLSAARATPPDSKPSSRRMSPSMSKRGLGTPRSLDTQPTSAPASMPSPQIVVDSPALLSEPEPPQSVLPPLILLGTPPSRSKQHKAPRKTQRQTAPSDSPRDSSFQSETPRATTTSSPRMNKNSSRASIAVELTPVSSARAAVLIYAQQPLSSRRCAHHHHKHKPKMMQDSSSQTSPPPTPTPMHSASSLQAHQLSPTQIPRKTHSPRDTSLPEIGNDTKLVPLTKAEVPASPPKSSKKHNPHHGHRSNGGGGGGVLSPNKRSGYCQRCTFEGRSCKINDCLKHQVLPQVTHATK